MPLVVPCLETYVWFCWSLNLQNNGRTALKPIFLDSGSPKGEGLVRVCVGLVCYHCIVHILNSSLSKNSIFFVAMHNSNLSRAMLPNYLRTYSSALCQIKGLEKAFKKQNNGQTVPKTLVLNACIWLAITLKIYMQYSTYFACNNDLCSPMLTNL